MRYIFIVILSLVQVTLNGQNLIKNSSFEDTVANCHDILFVGPPGYPTIAMAKHWFTPSLGSPDLYGGDFSTFCPYNDYNIGVDDNFVLPQDGLNYGGFGPYVLDGDSTENYREYIGGVLNQELVKDRKYCFSAYFRLYSHAKYIINNVGISFSNDSIYVPTLDTIGISAYAKMTKIFSDTVWKKVDFEIIAKGGEKYIYIGNFNTDEETDTLSTNEISITYFLVDQLDLHICPGQLENHLTVYPNPSDGHTIYIDQYADTTAELMLYNSIGQLMGYKQLPAGEYNGEVFSNLAAGVYILRMQTATGYREEERVIVVK